MKKLPYAFPKVTFLGVGLVLSICSASSQAQQTEFIIGAEWLNRPNQNPPHVPSAQDWTNIRNLGLNWGMVGYLRGDDVSYANTALAGAEQNQVKLILERYHFRDAVYGSRWQYHLEYASHYPSMGRVGAARSDNGAVRFPDDENNANDAWRAVVGTDPSGYMATGLFPNNEQLDGAFYYVKLRIRLETGTPLTHTPVVTVSVVRLSDNYQQDSTIYADQFGDYSYREITALSYTRNISGALGPPTQQSMQQVPLADGIGYAGVPHYAQQQPSQVGFDYRVYWPGQVTCYLDYLIIDDYPSDLTFTGYYDGAINSEVDLFEGRAGLGRFKITDEPSVEQYLLLGHVEQVIKANVIPSGYPSKTGFHFNVGVSYVDWIWTPNYVRRNLAWTQNNQTASNQYPILNTTPLPDNPSYTENYQSQIQSLFVDRLKTYITYAKQYSVPFWFTPQAHSWVNSLREPTTFELRQMVNLGLAYGAKGIHYFLYWSVPEGVGLVNLDGTPRTTIYGGTSYAGNKWETVRSINQQLGTLGPTLISLAWQDAFSRHQLTAPFSRFSLVGGANLVDLVADDGSIIDPQNETYVEVARLRAGSTDYLFVVNRRTAPADSRRITLSFNNTQAWTIIDVASGSAYSVSNYAEFSDWFAPGDGKLYRITLAPPPPPTLVSPANGATNVSTSPTLSWNASTGATSYGVQVSTSCLIWAVVPSQKELALTLCIV